MGGDDGDVTVMLEFCGWHFVGKLVFSCRSNQAKHGFID